MIELNAINTKTGLRMIERFDSGNRYYKITPANYRFQIYAQIKNTFKDKPVEIIEKGEWLMIKKTGNFEQVELHGKEQGLTTNEDDIINKELELLKNAGFIVIKKEI